MIVKWFGSVAMAAFVIGSCSQKSDDDLMTTTSPDAPKGEAGWVSAAPLSASAPAPSITDIPAGDYKLDPAHSTLMAKVSHLGFSHFTLWFETFSADLKLDPANPSAATLNATIDPASIMIPAPTDEFVKHLQSKDFMSAAEFPAVTFKSTAIEMTGGNTADVTGDLTFRGITKPVKLSMTYNGGYKGHVYEPRARIGFSAHGTFNRSDFGLSYGVPEPGASMGASDEVTIVIESEWLGPALPNPPAAPAN